MKKMACFVLALSLVFSFCGCGKKNAGQDKLTLRPGLYTVGKDLAPGVYAANPEDASKTAYVKLRSMAPGTEKAEMVVLGTGGSSADVILEDGRTMEVIFADVTFRLLNTDVAGAPTWQGRRRPQRPRRSRPRNRHPPQRRPRRPRRSRRRT